MHEFRIEKHLDTLLVFRVLNGSVVSQRSVEKMFYGSGGAERIKQARALKARIKKLIQDELEEGMGPW